MAHVRTTGHDVHVRPEPPGGRARSARLARDESRDSPRRGRARLGVRAHHALASRALPPRWTGDRGGRYLRPSSSPDRVRRVHRPARRVSRIGALPRGAPPSRVSRRGNAPVDQARATRRGGRAPCDRPRDEAHPRHASVRVAPPRRGGSCCERSRIFGVVPGPAAPRGGPASARALRRSRSLDLGGVGPIVAFRLRAARASCRSVRSDAAPRRRDLSPAARVASRTVRGLVLPHERRLPRASRPRRRCAARPHPGRRDLRHASVPRRVGRRRCRRAHGELRRALLLAGARPHVERHSPQGSDRGASSLPGLARRHHGDRRGRLRRHPAARSCARGFRRRGARDGGDARCRNRDCAKECGLGIAAHALGRRCAKGAAESARPPRPGIRSAERESSRGRPRELPEGIRAEGRSHRLRRSVVRSHREHDDRCRADRRGPRPDRKDPRDRSPRRRGPGGSVDHRIHDGSL